MNFSEWMQRRRGLVFAVPAGALAVLVILAAINFDSGSAGPRKPSRIKDAEALLAPRTASAEELARASGSIGDQTSVALASGAWIQVADETGRLAQQYSATKLEPLQGSQLAMTEPRAMMYMKDGRVLVLAARKGVAYAPRRALESGTLEEDVEVRLFKPLDGRAIDIDVDLPTVVVTAEQAQFNGVLGEVRCEKAVRVATDAGSFAGEGLTLVLDGDGDGLESLVVDRALEPIRVDRAARAMAEKRRAAREAAAARLDGSTSPSPVEPEARAQSTNAAQPSKASPFYRLTMLGGVEIVRIKDGVTSTITGDEIVAVFSLESRGLDDLAFVPAAAVGQSAMLQRTLNAPAALAILPLAFALSQEAAADSNGDSVTVTFGGKLVMLPANDPADQLATPDDIRFDVVGQRVEVLDGRSGSRILCSKLRYSVQDEYIEASGREGVPLSVTSSRMMLEGSRFTAALAKGEGRIDGAGRIAFGRGEPRDGSRGISRAFSRAFSTLEVAPGAVADIARMLVSADQAAVALVEPPTQEFRFDPSTQEIEITWKDGVDLRFLGDGDDAKLSLARFGGGVNVFGRQFEMDANSLEVAFSPTDSEQIDAIIADGGTKVRRLGGAGSMAAGRLELFLQQDSKGDTIPRRLVAKHAVEARDDRQTIWTEDLVVGFREKVPEVGDGAKKSSRSVGGARVDGQFGGSGQTGGDQLGGVDIDIVEARGGVQVLLKEGARVFAEELVGDAAKRKLRLTGENVAIVRTNIIADNLRDLRFDDASRSARSEGPGRFRAFKKPLSLGDGRIERPTPEGGATLDASWSEALDYSEVAESRGTLDIRGDVKVRSRPSPTTSDAIDAQSLLLELGLETGAKQNAADAERTLDHFIAKGGARLESRTWETAERVGDPRVFRVSGEHIEYDIRTREGLVVGDGVILVNVPKSAESKTVEKDRPAGGIALGVDGTTRFRWKRRMALERQYDDVFKITMESDVEMLHAGLRVDDSLSMRCDVLEATVKRPEESKKPLVSEPSASGPEASGPDENGLAKNERGVDLGGPAEMLGVKGKGHVFIRTPEQDIECGEFDYSVVTGVATLTAEEGRTVTIALKGQPAPIRAQQVVWDLRNGRIQISKVSGTGGR